MKNAAKCSHEASCCHSHPHAETDGTTLLIAGLLMVPMALQMMGAMMGINPPMPPWIQFFIATVVQFWCGQQILMSAFSSLSRFSANMDLLIALGTLTAYISSAVNYALKSPAPLYFETSVVIITLVLFGRWMEARSQAHAQSAVEKLKRLQPENAFIERKGELISLPVQDIVPEDVLYVRAGDAIAADGVVIEGTSTTNESLLTGESMPVPKTVGDTVYGGSINYNSLLRVRVVNVGAETLLSSIVRLLKQVQSSKMPIQRLVDRVSAVFVPVVVLLAVVVGVYWYNQGLSLENALMYSVAVLVIACPCALGLATPTVISVASGIAAERGIIFQDIAALEQVRKINTVLFDKTGTLTEGKPKVEEIFPAADIDKEEFIRLAAAVSFPSSHPLARAVVEEARKRNIPVEPVTENEEIPGKGLKATKRGSQYFLGSVGKAQQDKLPIDTEKVESFEKQGKTVNVFWSGNKILGYLVFSDVERPEVKKMISLFKKSGINTVMISGDNRKTVEALSQKLEMDTYEAEILPGEKVDRIVSLRTLGNVVAMVGDGINDAPALAAADIGIAINSGSDIAIAASDITVTSRDILSVYDAYDLSRATFRKIGQNLFFAFFYNILAIPLAASGTLTPMIAAAAMSLSSLCVIGNALLLYRWKSVRQKK